MNKYLPSKKFSFTLLSIVIALGIIYGFSWLSNKEKNTPVKMSGIETKAKVQEFMALDTDGDGMKDWEEALWKTDPNKTDTDGDGTIDSEEITLNRDPLKQNINPSNQAPSDKISEVIIAENKKVEEEFSKLSETDKMGRVMFSQYLATKKVGQTFTENEIANVIDSSIAIIPEADFKQYSISDLQIYISTTTDQIKNYGNQVATILLDNQIKEDIDITKIIDSIGEEDTISQMDEKLKQLQPLIDTNNKIAMELLKINVPKDFANIHLSMINGFKLISENIYQITTSTNDPIKMLSLINTYPDSINNLYTVFVDIQNLFTAKNIIFSTNDSGYKIFML